MAHLEQRFRRDPALVSRQIAGEVILVPIRKDAGDLESIYTLNESAASIWARLDGDCTLGEICDQIVAEYEVDLNQAQHDALELIAQLEGIAAVSPV